MNYNQTIRVILIKDVKSLFWRLSGYPQEFCLYISLFLISSLYFSKAFQAQIDYISVLRIQVHFHCYQVPGPHNFHSLRIFDTTIRTVTSYKLFWYVVEIMDIALYILKVTLNSFFDNPFLYSVGLTFQNTV